MRRLSGSLVPWKGSAPTKRTAVDWRSSICILSVMKQNTNIFRHCVALFCSLEFCFEIAMASNIHVSFFEKKQWDSLWMFWWPGFIFKRKKTAEAGHNVKALNKKVLMSSWLHNAFNISYFFEPRGKNRHIYQRYLLRKADFWFKLHILVSKSSRQLSEELESRRKFNSPEAAAIMAALSDFQWRVCPQAAKRDCELIGSIIG